MKRYKFSDIAYNITEKKMPVPGDEKLYIGLEHLDSGSLQVSRWGGDIELKGEKLVMRKGDILFGRRNTYLRRAAIAPHDGIFSAHGMIFRPNTDVVDPGFFPFFIASDYFMDEAIRISVGSLSPTVNWGTLKNLEFNLPDIPEQRHYAELLAAFERTKEAYKKLISATDDLVKSQFIEMFGDPVANPKGWEVIPLNKSCQLLTGNTPSRKESGYYGSFMEWIKSDNISPTSMFLSEAAERLSESGAAVGRVVGPGAILMTCIAGSLNTIGNVAIVDRQVAFNQQINALVPQKYETLVLYYLLQLIRPQLHEAANSALKCILNKGTLGSIRTIVPDRNLQKTFALLAEQSDKSKFAAQQTLKELTDAQKALMKKIFEQ